MTERKPDRQSGLLGGLQATTRAQGRGEPKIGVDEFMSVAERFGFSPATLAKIRAAAEAEDMGEGPFLANYYAKLPETKVQAMERRPRCLRNTPSPSVGTALHTSSSRRGWAPPGHCPAIGFSPRRRRWCQRRPHLL